MHVKKNEVFIFKAHVDETENEDPYAKLLRESGFSCKIICVLDFEYCNEDSLRECVMKPQEHSGIIFTSPRAVRAVSASLSSPLSLPPEWRQLSIFAVGESTKKVLRDELGLEGRSGDTENAQGLAEVITKGTYLHPILFPCSDLRKETLPSILTKANIAFTQIMAYHTIKHPQFLQNLMQATCRFTLLPEYMVFFSPSGVTYCLPELLKENVPMDEIKFVAIGPVTAEALKDAQLSVWSCASKPSPPLLLEAIRKKTVV